VRRRALITAVGGSLLAAPAAVLGQGKKAPAQGAFVGAQGVVTLHSSMLDFEDGSHLVMLSSNKSMGDKKDAWRSLAPGETRVVLLVHMKAEVGTSVFPEFTKEDVAKLFDMGKAKPEIVAGGFLHTNTTKQPLRLKDVFKAAFGAGKHLCKSGTVVLHAGSVPRKRLAADFALVFEGGLLAARLRFGV
jgi:hypothetical protein